MKEKLSVKTFKELPDTITPLDYAKWRNCGETKAREVFNSKGFPKIQGVGNKQLADKRAVFIYELGLNKEETEVLLKELARSIM